MAGGRFESALGRALATYYLGDDSLSMTNEVLRQEPKLLLCSILQSRQQQSVHDLFAGCKA